MGVCVPLDLAPGGRAPWGADVQLYANRGYPQFPATAREELALDAFLRGLAPECLRQHVRLSGPQTLDGALNGAVDGALDGALDVAEHAEALLEEPWTPPKRPPPPPDRRASGTSGRCCFRCGEPGHPAP